MKMWGLAAALFASFGLAAGVPQTNTDAAPWRFAVAGDSRNCGDVVMPGLAAAVQAQNASFYWHLGDFRAIYNFDEDMQHEPEHVEHAMSIASYETAAWNDFLQNQITPFGSVPVFLVIGNHELITPDTREMYVAQFGDWLDSPAIRQQRLKDDPRDHLLKTYYHWVQGGVDFIALDNASLDQFDADQMRWFESVLKRDKADPAIRSIVVGMHRPLPDSISANHGMNESAQGIASGRRAYLDLLDARDQANKFVYVIASHSHYYMADVFETTEWKAHGTPLPGWIVGTAGAQRYALPPNWRDAKAAAADVYGFLLGTVQSNGEIRFDFYRLQESETPAAVVSRFTPEFVHWCFAENSSPQQ